MQEDEPRGTAVQSVVPATRLLGCFRQGEPALTLTELVRRSGYSRTTTYRLLLTLEKAGWLERDEAAAFRLTIRLFAIGTILVDSLDLRRLGRPLMERLSMRSHLTVHLVVPSGPRAVCIERVDDAHIVRILHLDVGDSPPLHQGGAPRALLAHDQAALLPELLNARLEAEPPTTASSPEAVLEDLAVTRRRGYSVGDFGAAVGVAAVGAPVFDRSGRAIAGLGVSGRREQVLPREGYLAEMVQQEAAQLSTCLGGSGCSS
jgi:DNA-binding IclR family transcriptional regulator